MRSYRIIKDDLARKIVRDGMFFARRKPYISTQVDIDLNKVRKHLRDGRSPGLEKVSLTAAILHAYSKSLEAFPTLNSLLDYKSDLFVFDHIDVMVPIGIEHEGRAAIKYVIIKKMNRLNLLEVSALLNEYKKDRTLNGFSSSHRVFLNLPGFMRRIGYRLMEAFPGKFKQYLGSGLVSRMRHNSSKFGGLPFHTTSVFVGYEPGRAVHEKQEDIVPFSIYLDHRIADGEELLKFSQFFQQYLEEGRGIPHQGMNEE